MLEANRPFTEPRLAIIAGTPALLERAEAKTASMTAVLAPALQRRGVDSKLALLAARTGMAAFSHAASAWREDPATSFDTHLGRAFDALHGLSSPLTAASDRDIDLVAPSA